MFTNWKGKNYMKISSSEKTNQQKWYAPKQRFSIRALCQL